MRILLFAKSINGTENTGLMDVSKSPPELFCFCTKEHADEILALHNANIVNNNHADLLNSSDLDDILEEVANDIGHTLDYDNLSKQDVIKVLERIKNVRIYPNLLDYIIKCLSKQGISTSPKRFYIAVIHADKRMEYNESIHKTREAYEKHCIEGEFGLKKKSELYPMVFESIEELNHEMENGNGIEIFQFGNSKDFKFTIHEIGI